MVLFDQKHFVDLLLLLQFGSRTIIGDASARGISRPDSVVIQVLKYAPSILLQYRAQFDVKSGSNALFNRFRDESRDEGQFASLTVWQTGQVAKQSVAYFLAVNKAKTI